MLKYGSDCSGIEAPVIALKRLKKNVRHIFASDTDNHVRDMVKCNFTVDTMYDTANFDGNDKPYVDFYFAGFPCQPFSAAGKRRGFQDARGTVFFYIADYIAKKQPKVFVLENVKGLMSHDGGNTFNLIMFILNHHVGDYVIYNTVMSPDTHANWPQHRERVFIVGIRRDIQKHVLTLPPTIKLTVKASTLLDKTGGGHTLTDFEKKNLQYKMATYRKKGINIMEDYYFIDVGSSAHFGTAMFQKIPALKATRSNYYITKLRRKLSVNEIRKCQGFPLLNICVSQAQFAKQLGNSVCVPVLVRLFHNIFVACGDNL